MFQSISIVNPPVLVIPNFSNISSVVGAIIPSFAIVIAPLESITWSISCFLESTFISSTVFVQVTFISFELTFVPCVVTIVKWIVVSRSFVNVPSISIVNPFLVIPNFSNISSVVGATVPAFAIVIAPLESIALSMAFFSTSILASAVFSSVVFVQVTFISFELTFVPCVVTIVKWIVVSRSFC